MGRTGSTAARRNLWPMYHTIKTEEPYVVFVQLVDQHTRYLLPDSQRRDPLAGLPRVLVTDYDRALINGVLARAGYGQVGGGS